MSDEPLINAIHPDILPRCDPQFVEIYTKYQAPHLRADQVPYKTYNANRSKYTFAITPGPQPPVQSAQIHEIPVSEPDGLISVQVYVPTDDAIAKAGSKSRDGLLPVHVNFHGGGWVIGGLVSDAPWCHQICQAVGCIIVNVAYRMAPEFPHPVPCTDAWTSLLWVFNSASTNPFNYPIDRNRISIGGLSAGGNLAAVLAHLARDAKPTLPPLVMQMLIVPSVDVRYIPIEGPASDDCPYESYKDLEFAPCLPLNRMRWFCNLWLSTDPEQRRLKALDPRASPILYPSHADLAPARFFVAELDTLASEAQVYHEALLKAGTKSRLKVYKGVGHPFGHWDGELEKAKEFIRDTTAALKEAYGLI